MELYDFSETERLRGRAYLGNAGQKRAYLHDGVVWMVKFPQNTRDLQGEHLPSYTSSPISEYIGSHIYESLGIPTHETVLGRCSGKIVVGCKDFALDADLLEFGGIKNTVEDTLILGNFGSQTHGERLSDVLRVIDEADDFTELREEILAHFWDMFVTDAFIHNNDRNNGNWGLLVSRYTTCIAPVYDNGNAFFNKRNFSVTERRLNDESKIEEDAKSGLSFFMDDGDKHIHPFEFIESLQNEDCTAALARFAENIDMEKVRGIIEEIPEKAFGLSVISPETKHLYIKILETVIKESFNPTLEKIGHKCIDLSLKDYSSMIDVSRDAKKAHGAEQPSLGKQRNECTKASRDLEAKGSADLSVEPVTKR